MLKGTFVLWVVFSGFNCEVLLFFGTIVLSFVFGLESFYLSFFITNWFPLFTIEMCYVCFTGSLGLLIKQEQFLSRTTNLQSIAPSDMLLMLYGFNTYLPS